MWIKKLENLINTLAKCLTNTRLLIISFLRSRLPKILFALLTSPQNACFANMQYQLLAREYRVDLHYFLSVTKFDPS